MTKKLSVAICAHNEEAQIADCLGALGFADEIIILLDRCTDGTKAIAEHAGARTIEGAWPLEGDRRNAALAACQGDWILELDADERVTPALAKEIRALIETSDADHHLIPVDNYIGRRLVRHGWGASFGVGAVTRLTRPGVKHWGPQRVHPSVTFKGRKGAMLKNPLVHYVDRDISDMIRRLDRYSTARARDLIDAGDIGSLGNNVRRFFSRFIKCYVGRKGYREGGMGLLIALMAALFPLLSYLKARYDLNA